jgi:A/G-specific adenine glycosylase
LAVKKSFAARLIAWQKHNGRHDLPWQGTRDAYAVWLSEIMLQQTQVATVIPYYLRFLKRFPDVKQLAAAPLDDVLALWAGLGYYSRARNLHRAAGIIAAEHGGEFPVNFDQVMALPGVGRSTAAAICVFAYSARYAILDGNVKRVLARHRGVRGFPGAAKILESLWQHADALLPKKDIESYTQGLMDLGAGVCTRREPRCEECPINGDCVARARGLTGEIPAARPVRVLPRRKTTMLVLLHAGEVLLVKRPPSGIWGGLWSLPEINDDENVKELSLRRFGARVVNITQLPVVEHGFTHFKLSITPQRLRVSAITPQACEPGAMWLTVAEALGAAIPAPVRNILISI